MSQGLLEVHNADVVFSSGLGGRNSKAALRNVSMSVGGGNRSITAIVGESGSGKSTLIRMLLGFQAPTSGRVTWDGQDLSALDSAGRLAFRRKVQAIFQDPFDVFNPFYRIDHPLVTPLRTFGLAASRDEAYALIEAALPKVGLTPSETLGKYPHQLSGGQRQRVMIARALMLNPAIILADEPVSMVDASLRSTILDILYEMNRALGIAIVYVTHDLTTAYQVAETIVVLNGGQVMEVGAAEDVIHHPRHPYTRALIDAVPSPDPDVSWNLDADGLTTPDVSAFLPPAGSPPLVLTRTDPLRAIAAPAGTIGDIVTVAEIQHAVSRATEAATS